MKTIAVILAAVVLAAPVYAQAQSTVPNLGHSLKAAIAAQGSVCPPDGQDPDPYIVHG